MREEIDKIKEQYLDLFLTEAYRKQYEKARDYLLKIGDVSDVRLASDVNFYIFLMSFVTSMPEEIESKCKMMSLDDVRTNGDDREYGDAALTDLVRENILKQNFSHAMQILNTLRNNGKITKQNIVTMALVYEVKKKKKHQSFEIFKLVCESNYSEILATIKSNETHVLPRKYDSIRHLCEDILEMQKSGIALEKDKCSSSDINELIRYKNYSKAISQYEIVGRTKWRLTILDFAVMSMLEKARNISNSLGEKKVSYENTSNIIMKISEHLKSGDLIGARNLLEYYLKVHHLEEYLYFINSFIEMSLYTEDTSFVKPILMIFGITYGGVNLNVHRYLSAVYKLLKNDDVDLAILYLQLIKGMSKSGHGNMNPGELSLKIEELEELINTHANNLEDVKVIRPNKQE